MKLPKAIIALNSTNFQKDQKNRTFFNHSLGFERSELSNGFTENKNLQIDDIYYNVNELQRLSNQGIDVSSFKVANGIQSEKKRYGKKSRLI